MHIMYVSFFPYPNQEHRRKNDAPLLQSHILMKVCHIGRQWDTGDDIHIHHSMTIPMQSGFSYVAAEKVWVVVAATN